MMFFSKTMRDKQTTFLYKIVHLKKNLQIFLKSFFDIIRSFGVDVENLLKSQRSI